MTPSAPQYSAGKVGPNDLYSQWNAALRQGPQKPQRSPTIEEYDANPNRYFQQAGGYLGGPVNAYARNTNMAQQGDPYAAALGQYIYQHQNGIGQFASPSTQVYSNLLANQLGGLGTMNNLGNQIGNAYDLSNALSSGNMRAKYAPMYQYQGTVDTNRTNERMQQAALSQQSGILQGILPHIISALGGIGGGIGGGIRTDYGAGFGSPAQPTNTQQYRRNPLLAALGG